MYNDQIIKEVMKKALEHAKTTMNEDIGGPFGAAIIDQDGNIVAISSNSVLRDHDASAHAEMNAIRMAGEIKGTHDLFGCTLVTTTYPCPMCLSAAIWANIKHVVYGCNPTDAECIGFRDDFIYRFIQDHQKDQNIITLNQMCREDCLPLFEEYKKKKKIIY
jgi:guanine deaminase